MLDGVKAFWQRPYRDDMSAIEWFWFMGLLILIGAAWGLVLRAMK